MHILVSNDDGIFAPGIAVLAEAASKVGTVTVVSPDREQSGTSHSLTLHRPLRPRRRHDGSFQVDGTPTDCVLLAVGCATGTAADGGVVAAMTAPAVTASLDGTDPGILVLVW